MSSPPDDLRAVVFDCDGLLVETESRWTIAEVELWKRYGKTFGIEEKERLLGKSMGVAGAVMEPMLEQPGRGLELWDELLELVMPLIEHAEAMPGAVEVAAALTVPSGVASSSPRALVDRALKSAGLEFEISVAGDEVAHPKPSPDLYLEACRQLGVEPRHAIALEDSATGVAAARAAGVYVVGIPSIPGTTIGADFESESLLDSGVLKLLGVKSGPSAAD